MADSQQGTSSQTDSPTPTRKRSGYNDALKAAQKGREAPPVAMKTAEIPSFTDDDEEEDTEEGKDTSQQPAAEEQVPTSEEPAPQAEEPATVVTEKTAEEQAIKGQEEAPTQETITEQKPEDQDQAHTPKAAETVRTAKPGAKNGKTNGKGNTLKTDKGKTAGQLILGKGEKLVGGNVQKTIYMTLEQYQVLRSTRRALEDQTEQDINAQDIIRYLIEHATPDQFGEWEAFMETSRARDRRRKNPEEEE